MYFIIAIQSSLNLFLQNLIKCFIIMTYFVILHTYLQKINSLNHHYCYFIHFLFIHHYHYHYYLMNYYLNFHYCFHLILPNYYFNLILLNYCFHLIPLNYYFLLILLSYYFPSFLSRNCLVLLFPI